MEQVDFDTEVLELVAYVRGSEEYLRALAGEEYPDYYEQDRVYDQIAHAMDMFNEFVEYL